MYLTRRNRLALYLILVAILTLLLIAKQRGSLWNYSDALIKLKLPGDFIENRRPHVKSFCKFNYGLPRELKYIGKDVHFSPELGPKGNYRVLYNVTEAVLGPNVQNVTYATHVTAEFINYIPELLRFWDGPISIAAFVLDTDVAIIIEEITKYCYCMPTMSRVSLHLVYPKNIPPARKGVSFGRPTSCAVVDTSILKSIRHFDEPLMYPINVCRNVARQSALTEYVLVSDVQLMPSQDMARKFLRMLTSTDLKDVVDVAYVVPIFEVEETEDIPRKKSELVRLVYQNKAVYFHGMVCAHCQRFPGMEEWMLEYSDDAIKPFVKVKREYPFHRWEPLYIGKKTDPLYNELLSWEGLQDKMAQMMEMCLRNYDLVVLDGAFLVHWPGIKKSKVIEEYWRLSFIKENIYHFEAILKNLLEKYDVNPNCRIESAGKFGVENTERTSIASTVM